MLSIKKEFKKIEILFVKKVYCKVILYIGTGGSKY